MEHIVLVGTDDLRRHIQWSMWRYPYDMRHQLMSEPLYW